MGGPMQPMPQMAPGSTGIPGAGGGGGGFGGGLMGGGMMGPLAAAAGMLNASGPSRMPVGMGQVMGQGLMGMLQGNQLDQQQALQQQQHESLQRIGQQLGQAPGSGRMGITAPPPSALTAGPQGSAGAPPGMPTPASLANGPINPAAAGGAPAGPLPSGGLGMMPQPGSPFGNMPFFPSQQPPQGGPGTAMLASMPGRGQMGAMRPQTNPFIALMRQRGMMV